MAGETATPSLASFSIFSRCIALRGVSRGTRTSLPPSFMTQSAALSMRLPDAPEAILARVPMEHGQTIIVFGIEEPLARGDHTSAEGVYLRVPLSNFAPLFLRYSMTTREMSLPSQSSETSSLSNKKPFGETTNSTSSPLVRNSDTSLNPYTAPLAPVKATM